MKKIAIISLLTGIFFTVASCGEDSVDTISFSVPETYDFQREGVSTVSFSGQTTRIKMAEELLGAFHDQSKSLNNLNAMFAHQPGENNFSDASLNASDKNLRSKVAASADYFSTNTVVSAEIRSEFDQWISSQVSEVFPNWSVDATPGVAGVIQQAGGGTLRYVNEQGLEYDQLIGKGLIGALMMDQMLNNYLSPALLDAGNNREDNDNEVLVDGKNYTTMEHYWDEAYGYVYGASQDPQNPNQTIGSDDEFFNEYLGKVNDDPDFNGIADEVFDAFKLGRAAIVADAYEIRDEQAEIIQSQISKVIAIRAVYYLQSGKLKLQSANPDYASIFHSLSEAYGFIYNLQFSRDPETGAPYFSRGEVESLLNDLLGDGTNGLWDVTATSLDNISTQIANAFDFTIEEASN